MQPSTPCLKYSLGASILWGRGHYAENDILHCLVRSPEEDRNQPLCISHLFQLVRSLQLNPTVISQIIQQQSMTVLVSSMQCVNKERKMFHAMCKQ